jgi:hypothetical protein
MKSHLAKHPWLSYNPCASGRGSVRLEHTVRDREVGGSNPLAPTEKPHSYPKKAAVRFRI